MTERAQALEAVIAYLDAIDEIATIGAAPKHHTGQSVMPPPYNMTPSTAKNIKWNTREIRSRLALLAVQPPPPVGSPTTERDQLREALAAIQQSTRDDEKGEQWTIRNFLNKHGVFNDDISGSRRLVAEACRYVLSTPVEPAGASEPPKKWIPTEGCTCYLCRAARLSPAPVSPVAPEPPTETRSEL